ncbi:MAG: GLPGLI family protein [Bacteroidota bacterium]
MKPSRKIFFLIFTFSMGALRGMAQDKPEMAQAIIHYKFSHVRDTTNRQDLYNENMILFLGSHSSAYKSYDKKMADALVRKQIQEQMANNPGGNVRIMRGKNSGSNTEYYQFAADGKLVRRERLINSYLIEEPMPAISWKIENDTASFGGLHCQKATTHFKGRDYIAWFCPDLPFRCGPWKLNGLPGVIVDAHDTKNEVVFKFDGVEKVTPEATAAVAGNSNPQQQPLLMFGGDDPGDPNMIQLPSGAIKTTDKEYTDLRAAMQKDPNAFANAAMGAAGAGPQGGPGGNGPQMKMNIKVAPGPVINNPIELPEKK